MLFASLDVHTPVDYVMFSQWFCQRLQLRVGGVVNNCAVISIPCKNLNIGKIPESYKSTNLEVTILICELVALS